MTYDLNCSNSDACCQVTLNPLRGTATVWHWSSGPYTYRNVSRRALLKAAAEDCVMGGLPSVGQWVNRTLRAR